MVRKNTWAWETAAWELDAQRGHGLPEAVYEQFCQGVITVSYPNGAVYGLTRGQEAFVKEAERKFFGDVYHVVAGEALGYKMVTLVYISRYTDMGGVDKDWQGNNRFTRGQWNIHGEDAKMFVEENGYYRDART